MFGMPGNKITVAHSAPLIYRPNVDESAIDLEALEKTGHEGLAKNARAAGISLKKAGQNGVKADGVLIVDHSGSMANEYSSGAVQRMAERYLGFVLQIDVDGQVPVIGFDGDIYEGITASVSNYRGIIERELRLGGRRRMGGTDLRQPLKALIKLGKKAKAPIHAAILSDGDNSNRRYDDETLDLFWETSRYPIFIKPIVVRHVELFDYVDRYTGPKRLLDNINTQRSTYQRDLLACSEAEFADAMLVEWASWTQAALAAGVLTRA